MLNFHLTKKCVMLPVQRTALLENATVAWDHYYSQHELSGRRIKVWTLSNTKFVKSTQTKLIKIFARKFQMISSRNYAST